MSAGKGDVEAMQSYEIKVGGSSIKIDQMGITIKGMMIKIEGTMKLEAKGLMTDGQGRRHADGQGRHGDDQLMARRIDRGRSPAGVAAPRALR